MSTRLASIALTVLTGMTFAAATRAQSLGTKALAQARDSIDQGSFDAALSLVATTLKVDTTSATRVRAYVLRGVVLTLEGGQESAAVEAFRQAILIDPTLKVDSLQSLSNQLLRVFGEARDALASAARARMGELELRGLPDTGVVIEVDDTVWTRRRRAVMPGWRYIAIDAEGFTPYSDSALVDSGETVVKEIKLERPALNLSLQLPDSQTVAASDARLNFALEVGRASHTTVTLASSAGTVVCADTQSTSGVDSVRLSLRRPDGSILPPGRYVIAARASDEWGVTSDTVRRTFSLSRAKVDTEPTPPRPAASSYLPEAVRSHPGPGGPALGSLLLGALTIALPSAIANPDLGSSATRRGMAIAVGGTLSLAGIVSFFAGTEVRPSAGNIRANAQRRSEYARSVQETARANASLRENAPILVRLERAAP